MTGSGTATSRGGRLRGSLQTKAVGTTLVIALLLLSLISVALATLVRDGIFTQRVDVLLAENARSAERAQSTFNASNATNGTQVQQLLNDTVVSLQGGASGERALFVWHALDSAPGGVYVNDVSTAPQYSTLISDQLRESVTAGDEAQYWQSVAIDDGDQVVPGLMVGSLVTVPLAGEFELYSLYSLAPEASTLQFVSRVLWLSAALMAIALAIIIGLVTRQVVRPVSRAATTAKRLAEGHLAERLPVRGQDEVAVLGESFNAMAESLQAQIEQLATLSTVQRRFVSDVSHELRTPLTTVRMATEMLYGARDDFDPHVRRSAELLSDQLDRFEALLADLLEISRFDAGAVVLDAERRDLRALVSNEVAAAQPLADSKEVALVVDLGGADATADVDAVRVQRIVRNLIVNAIEHAEGEPVEITVRADTTAVAVRVLDHGVGLSNEEREHVFDRFWRADLARTRTTGGTGLGLAISQEDATLHGGWLDVWGRPRQGASFRLTLPRRAGIVLARSPIALEPELPDDETPGQLDRRSPGFDPSDMPDFPGIDDFEEAR